MKKMVSIVMVAALSLFLLPVFSKAAEAPISVVLDSAKLSFPDAKPFKDKQGRVQVPVRFVSEELKAEVGWDDATQTVTVKSGDMEAVLVVGSDKALVNGKEVSLGTTAVKVSGRVFVPVRFVSEVLQRRVVWDQANSTVHIWNLFDEKTLAEKSLTNYDDDTIPHDDHVSYHLFDIQNKKLFFEDSTIDFGGPFKGYVPSEKQIPNLNQKLYDMVRYLADDKNFTRAQFATGDPEIPDRILLNYSKTNLASMNQGYYFNYTILLNGTYQSAQNHDSSIVLKLSGLFWDEDTKGTRIVPYIENKLRMSLVALFGDVQGIQIHNWAMELYNGMTKDKAKMQKDQSKKFGNIQVEYNPNGSSQIILYFSLK